MRALSLLDQEIQGRITELISSLTWLDINSYIFFITLFVRQFKPLIPARDSILSKMTL